MGPPPFTFPKMLEHWKGPLTGLGFLFAWYIGSSGWISIGPGDRIARLESQEANRGLQMETVQRQVSRLTTDVGFVTELLCQPVLADTAGRSQGDQYLRSRCRAATGQVTGAMRASAEG